jgi:hypothetical protein
MPKANADCGVSIGDKLHYGKITTDEFCALAGMGKTVFYEKVRAGEIVIEKDGARSKIDGPWAKAYLRGDKKSGEAA